MSRLTHLQNHELAIQTIAEELDYLEGYLASCGDMHSHDLQDLSKCLLQPKSILVGIEQKAAQAWQEDQEPLPEWLQPKQAKSSSDYENSSDTGSAVA